MCTDMSEGCSNLDPSKIMYVPKLSDLYILDTMYTVPGKVLFIDKGRKEVSILG